MPLINPTSFKKSIVRFHGFDLYEEERNFGYIPFRKPLLETLTIAALISQNGINYLSGKYPEHREKYRLLRLGTLNDHVVDYSRDGVLRVVSCARLIPLKRVPLIGQALMLLDIPVIWTHLGDGDEMKSLLDLKNRMPKNVIVNLTGMIEADSIFEFYKREQIDLFISVSSSEGVPVSIMESLSVGVPVYATDVGGTKEVVDENVGKLLSINIRPDALANEILKYYHLPLEVKGGLRIAARERYLERCDSRKLAENLANEILS